MEYTLDEFEKVFEMANNSNFLCGQVTDFRANFDWLMKEDNFLKVFEGGYQDFEIKKASDKPDKKTSYDLDEYDLNYDILSEIGSL